MAKSRKKAPYRIPIAATNMTFGRFPDLEKAVKKFAQKEHRSVANAFCYLAAKGLEWVNKNEKTP